MLHFASKKVSPFARWAQVESRNAKRGGQQMKTWSEVEHDQARIKHLEARDETRRRFCMEAEASCQNRGANERIPESEIDQRQRASTSRMWISVGGARRRQRAWDSVGGSQDLNW
jgi:hypothetical protein